MDREIKILLVDDEPDFTQPMAFWLKTKGYTVLTAVNGEEGIEAIKGQNPDIVFMDINMPLMDGFTALKLIREFNKELPIIIISAYVGDPRVREMNAYGISGVFYKGSDFEEGLSLLEVALRQHKQLKK